MSTPQPAPRRAYSAGDLRWPGQFLKLAALGLLDAAAIWFGAGLFRQGSHWLLVFFVLGVAAVNVTFLTERLYPLRYLLPGLLFMAAMIVYPLVYNVYIAFTNYGTGNILTKQTVIEQLESRMEPAPGAPRYTFTLFADGEQQLTLLLESPEGERFVSDGQNLIPLDQVPEAVDLDGDGQIDRIGDALPLSRLQIVRHLSALQAMRPEGEGRSLQLASSSHFQELVPRYRYDAARDAMVDQSTGTVYTARGGFFTSPEGERLIPGFQAAVGLANFVRLVANRSIAGPFLRVFLWTFAWAAGSVALTFALGLALALALNDPRLRFKEFYRSVLILPYAIPGFVSALIWRGMFNTEFGQVNRIVEALFGVQVPWLQDPFWAKVALLIVNLWLGFPYMMIVCLGALQSISPELYEAAYCDGATWRQQLKEITLPILMMSVGPLLVSSFAFNFNNFTVIYLVTRGRPPIPGADTPAGATDILISYTYRLAFEGGRGADYGLAAAVSLIIFLIVGTITWLNFRFTRALEEVSESV